MVADAARVKDLDAEDNGGATGEGKVERRSLKTKEDIMNYVNGLM